MRVFKEVRKELLALSQKKKQREEELRSILRESPLICSSCGKENKISKWTIVNDGYRGRNYDYDKEDSFVVREVICPSCSARSMKYIVNILPPEEIFGEIIWYK